VTHLKDVISDLVAQGDQVGQLVAGLAPTPLQLPTPPPGWTIAHQIAHLAATFRMAALAAPDAEAFRTFTSQLSDDFEAKPKGRRAMDRSMPRTGEVMLLRWPAEAARRARYKAMGVLRLLVVEGGAPAPICSDIREDWVRAPITEADLRARMASLSARADAHRLPRIDPYGVLRFCDRSTSVSPTETDLMQCLIRQFKSLVPRDELHDCLPERAAGCSRNALDLHIMRLRRRIRPLGLIIRTIRGRGYMLQAATDEPTQTSTRPRRPKPDHNITSPQPTTTNAEVTPLRWPRTPRSAAV